MVRWKYAKPSGMALSRLGSPAMNCGALERISKNGGASSWQEQMPWFLIFRSGKNYGVCFACLIAGHLVSPPARNQEIIMSSHLHNLIERYSALEVCRSDIQQAFDLLTATFLKDGKLLLCGNGGSAADSEHWAGEMLKGFAHARPLSTSIRKGLPSEMAAQLQWAFPVIPLTGFPAFATAFSND